MKSKIVYYQPPRVILSDYVPSMEAALQEAIDELEAQNNEIVSVSAAMTETMYTATILYRQRMVLGEEGPGKHLLS